MAARRLPPDRAARRDVIILAAALRFAAQLRADPVRRRRARRRLLARMGWGT